MKREILLTFLNAAKVDEEAKYQLLGEDLEELTTTLNAQVETKQNILGHTKIRVTGYSPESTVSPFYPEQGTPLYERLQEISDNRLTGDDLKADTVKVHLWEETAKDSGVYKAVKESCIIVVTSEGGGTSGYDIPFNLNYLNDPVKGTFDMKTKTFTETLDE